MKKILAILAIGLALSACTENKPANPPSIEVEKQKQSEYIQSWKDQGIDNFSFEGDYLIYKVKRSEVTTDPDWVAKQQYDMAADVENIRGCRLVDENGNEFGRYEP